MHASVPSSLISFLICDVARQTFRQKANDVVAPSRFERVGGVCFLEGKVGGSWRRQVECLLSCDRMASLENAHKIPSHIHVIMCPEHTRAPTKKLRQDESSPPLQSGFELWRRFEIIPSSSSDIQGRSSQRQRAIVLI